MAIPYIVPIREAKDDYSKLNGPQKAAIFLMALGEETAIK